MGLDMHFNGHTFGWSSGISNLFDVFEKRGVDIRRFFEDEDGQDYHVIRATQDELQEVLYDWLVGNHAFTGTAFREYQRRIDTDTLDAIEMAREIWTRIDEAKRFIWEFRRRSELAVVVEASSGSFDGPRPDGRLCLIMTPDRIDTESWKSMSIEALFEYLKIPREKLCDLFVWERWSQWETSNQEMVGQLYFPGGFLPGWQQNFADMLGKKLVVYEKLEDPASGSWRLDAITNSRVFSPVAGKSIVVLDPMVLEA